MRRGGLVVAAAVAAGVSGCGGDGDDEVDGTYDVVLVVGAVMAEPGAEPVTVDVGTEYRERWELDCGDDGCTLSREPGDPLGDLTELRLEPVEDGDAVEGTAPGVEAVEPAPGCASSPTQRWTVTVDLSRDDGVVAGSVLRIPEAATDGDCSGVDLTLGFSGTRAP